MAHRFTVNTVMDILGYSFEKLDAAFKGRPQTKLMFPKYSDGNIRISEQELRFAFVEELNERDWPVFYSVETPTDLKYRFSPDGKRPVPRVETEEDRAEGVKTESAQFDLVIHHRNGERMCLVEFKGKVADYKKDFLKLNCESGTDRPGFFVEILKNENRRTTPSIRKKIESVLGNVIYVCHVLETGNTYVMANDPYVSEDPEGLRENWKQL